MKSEKQSETRSAGKQSEKSDHKATLQTIVGRVLQRELEHKRQQSESLETSIAETEKTLVDMRDHRIEMAKDIALLEQALKDLEE